MLFFQLLVAWVCLLVRANGLNKDFAFDVYDSETHHDDSLAGMYKNISDSSLLWGPYRSGMYFGLRPRIPRSLLLGLAWFNVDSFAGLRTFRHFYEQGDNMGKANWVYYDPRYGGRQIISDKDCHINIILTFVKSDDGLSWGVNVKAKPHKGYENVKTSFIWHAGLEGSATTNEIGMQEYTSILKLDGRANTLGYEGSVKLTGADETLGLFTLEITDGPSSNKHPEFKQPMIKDTNPQLTHHLSLRVPDDNVWRAKDIVMTLLQESVEQLRERYETIEQFPSEQALILRDLHKYEGNLHLVQKIYQGGCEFDILYNNALTPKAQQFTAENIKSRAKKAIKKFNEKFSQNFVSQAPFDDEKYTPFAKEILSGLLGGLSYFYGDHLVDRETVFDEDSFESYKLEGSFEGPHELFTLVPSRPFFPRGFLWDEGFHLLPLLEYDSDLVLEILKSWFQLIDDDGWIAREQILGPEARARVPEEFQVQSPHIVNPPTLMLTFTYLLNALNQEKEDIDAPIAEDFYGDSAVSRSQLGNFIVTHPEVLKNYTESIYPKLKAHYEMFRRTQKGLVGEFDRDENLEAYRWRGRTLTHCLASGLDDYPRPLPADVAELNVDLLSWIGVMTRSIKLTAGVLGYDEDYKKYEEIERNIIHDLNKLHWSQEEKTYCDLTLDEDDDNTHVCFKGYISLFPFITKLVDPSEQDKIESIVDLIADPEQLWSEYGIRSLSKSDPNYKTGEDYWKSPIWVHMNYLVLDGLKYYKEVGSDFSESLKHKLDETYTKLRVNLVENIYNQWKKTGYVWEQYNDETGQGQKAKNFLGWTSSVILMMKMPQNI